MPVALLDRISQVPKPAMRRGAGHDATSRAFTIPSSAAAATRSLAARSTNPTSGVCGVHSTLHFFVRHVLLARREMPLVTERVRNERDAVTEEFVRQRPQ